jgi:hypothetical protein
MAVLLDRTDGDYSRSRKVSAADVVVMRTAFAGGEHEDVLGRRYGISGEHVKEICAGRAWPNAGGPITRRPRRNQHWAF